MLGGGLIDPEEDLETWNLAIDLAMDRYRQVSSNSVEESGLFLTLKLDKNEYVLPQEVIEVRKIYRKNFGMGAQYGGSSLQNGMPNSADGNTGSNIDPFDLSYQNSILLSAQGAGGFLSYELYMQYLNVAGRLFGLELIFTFNVNTKKLTLQRRPRMEGEECLLHVYNYIHEDILLHGTYSKSWLRSYSLAQAKIMIGQAYSRYSQLPGPSGGITLNGPSLIQEGKEELEKLDQEILLYRTGEFPYQIMRG